MSFGSLPSVLGNGGGVAISVIGGTGLFADGTAAAPSISFAAQTSKGFWSPGTSALGVALGSSTAYFEFTRAGLLSGVAGDYVAQLDVSDTGALKLQNYRIANNNGSSITLGAPTSSNTNITLTPSGTGQTLVTGLGVTGSAGAQASGQWMEFATVGTTYALLRAYNRTGSAGMNLVLNDAGGNVQIGTTVNSGALLQIGTNTTAKEGGMVFGTDTFLHRYQAGGLALDATVGAPSLTWRENGNAKSFVYSNAGIFYLGTSTAAAVILQTNGTTALTLDSSQNATFAGYVAAAVGSSFTWLGRSAIRSSADSVIALTNNAGTDFSRLQFGGTTSSFPALKRSGANLIVRAADDSADAAILAFCHVSTGVAITANPGAVSYGGTTATTVGAAGGASLLPATPLGYIIVNVAGTSAKIPYYNA